MYFERKQWTGFAENQVHGSLVLRLPSVLRERTSMLRERNACKLRRKLHLHNVLPGMAPSGPQDNCVSEAMQAAVYRGMLRAANMPGNGCCEAAGVLARDKRGTKKMSRRMWTTCMHTKCQPHS